MTTQTQTKPKTAPTAQDRQRRCIEDLRLVMHNLAELIDVENTALSSHDIDTVKALAANKWTLARNYRNQMQAVADAPDILQILGDDERTDLRSLGERLQSASERNERLLSANMEAANRVMHAVVNGVKQAQERNAIYGKTGALKGSTSDGRPMAVSYNKEL
ncbi:MAG: flagellar export chaperone FlgN [Rhodospirillaceae bacterium]|nr:flagellar export chaperone FlgN [Rhodospirillaceae bacterium]